MAAYADDACEALHAELQQVFDDPVDAMYGSGSRRRAQTDRSRG